MNTTVYRASELRIQSEENPVGDEKKSIFERKLRLVVKDPCRSNCPNYNQGLSAT